LCGGKNSSSTDKDRSHFEYNFRHPTHGHYVTWFDVQENWQRVKQAGSWASHMCGSGGVLHGSAPPTW
jgi:hypothetical protein